MSKNEIPRMNHMKAVNPWQRPKDRPLMILAPMEAVTDTVFRHVIKKAAPPDIYFTEFVSTDGYISELGRHSTRNRLYFTPDEQPIIAQIWGNKPENFCKMSIDLADMGFSGVDINMGCPDKAVVKQGSGSGLIHNHELSAEIIAATKEGGLPVSVKTRLGNIRADEWESWIAHLLRQDLANLTIHLRSRKEMSKVAAHYEMTPEIIKMRNEIAPQTLITINGDIKNYQHGMELYQKYHVDGIMIGRGIFENPFAFSEYTNKPTKERLLELFFLHLKLHDEASLANDPRKFDPLKRFFKIYIKDFPGASGLRHKLMQSKSTVEACEIVNDFLNQERGN